MAVLEYKFGNLDRHNTPSRDSEPLLGPFEEAESHCESRAIDWWFVGLLLSLGLSAFAQGYGIGLMLS